MENLQCYFAQDNVNCNKLTMIVKKLEGSKHHPFYKKQYKY